MTALGEARFDNLLDVLPSWVKQIEFDQCLVQFFVSFFDLNNETAMAKLNASYEKFSVIFPAFLRVIELQDLKLTLSNADFSKPRNGVLNVSLRPGPPCGLSFGGENCAYGQS
jgi:hypothetical protein